MPSLREEGVRGHSWVMVEISCGATRRTEWAFSRSPGGCSDPTTLSPAETLYYTDDTAMARALVQSLLAKAAFDEVDMAHR